MKKTKKELEEEIVCLRSQRDLEKYFVRRTTEKMTALLEIIDEIRVHHDALSKALERCTPGEDHARNR